MPKFKLSPRARKATLVGHVLSSGAWIGIDVVFAVLVVGAAASDDQQLQGVAYRAIAQFLVAPMLVMAVISLLTGVLLGLGTKYGLLKYWWVAAKLVINVVLIVLVLAALRPSLDEVRQHGEALLAGTPSDTSTGDLVFPPLVSLAALSVATTVSVFKPWGRLLRDRGRSPGSVVPRSAASGRRYDLAE